MLDNAKDSREIENFLVVTIPQDISTTPFMHLHNTNKSKPTTQRKRLGHPPIEGEHSKAFPSIDKTRETITSTKELEPTKGSTINC